MGWFDIFVGIVEGLGQWFEAGKSETTPDGNRDHLIYGHGKDHGHLVKDEHGETIYHRGTESGYKAIEGQSH